MTTATISIEVDSETARAFIDAAPKERRKLELLLALRLRELTSGPTRPLREVMDEMSANAESRGLTPELLDSILRDE